MCISEPSTNSFPSLPAPLETGKASIWSVFHVDQEMVLWTLFWFWLLKSSVATSVKTIIMHEKALTQSPFKNTDYQWMEKVQNLNLVERGNKWWTIKWTICSRREFMEKQLQPELMCGDAISMFLPFLVRKLWLSLLISWLQGHKEVCKYQIAGMKQHCRCYRNL